MTKQKKDEMEKIVKAGIAEYLPVLARYFDYSTSLVDHSKTLHEFTGDAVSLKRQKPIANMIARYIERVHGVSVRVKTPLAINIMDHHTMLNNPLSLATNIVANAACLLNKPGEPLIVFTTSIPPQDNYFSDVRFAGQRIQFFSKNEIPQSTCFMPVREFRCIERLKEAKKWSALGKDDQTFLEWFETFLNTIDYSRARNLNDQISIMNRVLFKYLFAEEIRDSLPDLFYISNEDIIRECAGLIFEEDSFFTKSLFDEKRRTTVLERFEGMQGCWDKEHGKGTHFFWYRKENNRPAPLWIAGNALVSEDGSFSLPFDRESVIKALEEWRILPNLFVIYGWMTFFAGVKPLVGFGSMNYISKMKEAWCDVLADYDDGERERIQGIDTYGLIGGLVATYKRDAAGVLQSQYALDLIADKGLSREYIEHLVRMPFHVLFAPALLEIYGNYVPAGARKEHSLQPSDVMGKEFDWIQ